MGGISLDPGFDTQGLLCYAVSSVSTGLDDDLVTLRANAVYEHTPRIRGDMDYPELGFGVASDEDIASGLLGSAATEGLDGSAADVTTGKWEFEGPDDPGRFTVLTATANVTPDTYEFSHYPLSGSDEDPVIRPRVGLIDSTVTGTLFGNPDCGTFHRPGDACVSIDAEEVAGWLGLDPGGATGVPYDGSDGSKLCFLHAAGAEDPFAIIGIEIDFYGMKVHLQSPYQADCLPHAEHGAHGIGVLSCGGGEFTSLVMQLAPSLGVDPPADSEAVAEQRIWLDVLHAHGVDVDSLLSEETYERVTAMVEEIVRPTRIDVGLDH